METLLKGDKPLISVSLTYSENKIINYGLMIKAPHGSFGAFIFYGETVRNFMEKKYVL